MEKGFSSFFFFCKWPRTDEWIFMCKNVCCVYVIVIHKFRYYMFNVQRAIEPSRISWQSPFVEFSVSRISITYEMCDVCTLFPFYFILSTKFHASEAMKENTNKNTFSIIIIAWVVVAVVIWYNAHRDSQNLLNNI